mmetsp:Transcript_82480/g.238237  ORF Transcript_82480/g.238237 Transcript_82480/m.238237 type:complete len:158 (+) Transcript_82480:102-575(+)
MSFMLRGERLITSLAAIVVVTAVPFVDATAVVAANCSRLPTLEAEPLSSMDLARLPAVAPMGEYIGWSHFPGKQDHLGCVLLLSFMMLRVAFVSKSVSERSLSPLWMGLLLACLSRCVAEDVLAASLDVVACKRLAVVFMRELMHAGGLLTILRLMR